MNNLIERVGFDDGHGNLSFNKLVTAFMCGLFAVIVLRKLVPTPTVITFGTLLVCAGFGLKGLMAFIAKSTFATQLAHEHKMAVTANANVNVTGDVTAAVNTVAQGLVHRLDARSPHGGE